MVDLLGDRPLRCQHRGRFRLTARGANLKAVTLKIKPKFDASAWAAYVTSWRMRQSR